MSAAMVVRWQAAAAHEQRVRSLCLQRDEAARAMQQCQGKVLAARSTAHEQQLVADAAGEKAAVLEALRLERSRQKEQQRQQLAAQRVEPREAVVARRNAQMADALAGHTMELQQQETERGRQLAQLHASTPPPHIICDPSLPEAVSARRLHKLSLARTWCGHRVAQPKPEEHGSAGSTGPARGGDYRPARAACREL